MTKAPSVIPFPEALARPGLNALLRPSGEDRAFSRRGVGIDVLEELHALMAVGPGMTGASPTRLLFASSPAAKGRLSAQLAPFDRQAAILAPVCAVIAYDEQFAEQMLAFVGDGVGGESCFDEPARLKATAMRNSVLQGAYLALSARALGLETVFFNGFDACAITSQFFAEQGLRTIFVAALGYPPSGLD